MKLLLGVVAHPCIVRAFLSYTDPFANKDSQVFLQFIKQFVSSVFPQANIFSRTSTNCYHFFLFAAVVVHYLFSVVPTMCWVYSKQKITVIIAHGPQPCTKPHCSSHSTSAREVNSRCVNTGGPVFRLALLSFMCVAGTFRVVSHVSEHNREQLPRGFSQLLMGKCLCPFYKLQS